VVVFYDWEGQAAELKILTRLRIKRDGMFAVATGVNKGES
jgi:hypothetical protein